MESTGYVYDVILENRGLIESERCYIATFGNKYDLEKFKHEFFGSERIVDRLKDHPSYVDGFITLEEFHYVRDEESSLIFVSNWI